MNALARLPSIQEMLEVEDLDAIVVQISQAIELEQDLGQLHDFASRVEGEAAIIRLRGEVGAAQKVRATFGRIAAHAHWELGRRLRALDGGGPGKPKSERTRAAEAAAIKPREVDRLVKLGELDKDAARQRVDEVEAKGKDPTVWALLNDEERDGDEAYTPALYIHATEEVFDQRPDCDPASSAVAQLVVQAGRFWSRAKPELGKDERAAGITTDAQLGLILDRWGGVGEVYDAKTGEVLEEDASITDAKKRRKAFAARAKLGRLTHAAELRGKVWCNPPYSFPGPFVRAIVEGYMGRSLDEVLAAEAEALGKPVDDLERVERRRAIAMAAAGRPDEAPITEAILLVNVATGTWAQQLALAASSAQCWVEGRINFTGADGQPIKDGNSGNRYEQVFICIGPDPERFAEVFGRFGMITYGRPR